MKWVMIALVWMNGQLAPEGTPDRSLVEFQPTKQECMIQQKKVVDDLERLAPATASASYCMSEVDYALWKPASGKQGPAASSLGTLTVYISERQ